MTHKIVVYSTDDVALDASTVASALTHACKGRQRRYYVRGLCQVDDSVYSLLLPVESGAPVPEYIFISIEDTTKDGVTSLLYERWLSGFDAVGTVSLSEGVYLVLFAMPTA